MKKYKIGITETLYNYVIIEGESEDDAIGKANDMYLAGNVDMSDSELVDYDIHMEKEIADA